MSNGTPSLGMQLSAIEDFYAADGDDRRDDAPVCDCGKRMRRTVNGRAWECNDPACEAFGAWWAWDGQMLTLIEVPF